MQLTDSPGPKSLILYHFLHANFITVENGKDAAPHYRDHYGFPNLGLEPQS